MATKRHFFVISKELINYEEKNDVKFKAKDRRLISEKAIDAIYKRSAKKGIDKTGKKFVAYEKSYAKKKGKKKVDLVLSDRLLNSMGLLQNKPGRIVIGYDKNDDRNTGVADGNIRGTYGQSSPIPGKARDFLGLPYKDLQAIIEIVGANVQDRDNG